MVLTARELGVKSVPVNVLNPIPGTPYENNPALTNDEVRRIVAIFRFIIPDASIRLAGGRGLLALLEWLVRDVEGRRRAVFGYHPLILAVTLLATGLTIGVSVWLPARKLSVLTPLEAIKKYEGAAAKEKETFSVFYLVFLA